MRKIAIETIAKLLANEANDHCSKTEQQKRARLDRRIEAEEALNRWNKYDQGLIKG